MKNSFVLCLLCISSLSLFAQDFNPVGYLSIGTYGSHQYFISNASLTYEEAQVRAADVGGYLLSIETILEQTYLQNNITDTVFIGLNTDQQVPIWDNNEPLTFTNIATTTTADAYAFDPETKQWIAANPATPSRFIIEYEITYLDECSQAIGAGEILCSNTLDNGQTELYILDTAYQVTLYTLDHTGAVLSATDEGMLVQDSLLMIDNQIIKQLVDGSIAWTKSIPTEILENYPSIIHATETTTGDILLAAIGTQYADYPYPTDSSEIEILKSKDSIIVIRTDANMNFKRVNTVYRSSDLSYGFDDALDYTKIYTIKPEPNDGFMIAYTWHTPPQHQEINYTVFSKYDSFDERIVYESKVGLNFKNLLLTPCGDYKSQSSIVLSGTNGTGEYWFYPDLTEKSSYKYLNRWGWAANDWIERSYESSEDSIGLSYYLSGFQPHPTIGISIPPKSYSMFYVPFSYAVRTGMERALIFYHENGIIHAFDTACLDADSCDIESAIENIQCNDNGTSHTRKDDFLTADILVTGTGDTWKAYVDGEYELGYRGFMNVPTTIKVDSRNVDLIVRHSTDIDCENLLEDIYVEPCSNELPDFTPLNLETQQRSIFSEQDTLFFSYNISNESIFEPTDTIIEVTYGLSRDVPYVNGYVNSVRKKIEIKNMPVGEPLHIEDFIVVDQYVYESKPYYLLVHLDPSNRMEQLNISPKIIYDSLIVTLFSSDYLYADLVPENLDIPIKQVNQGKSLSLSYQIRNIGLGDIETPVSSSIFISRNNKIDSTDIRINGIVFDHIFPDVTPNILTQQIDIPEDLSIGTYYAIIVADANNEQVEFDEQNNIIQKTFTVIDKDIIIASPDAPIILDSLTNIPQFQTVQLSPNPATTNIQINFSSEHKTNSNIKIVDSTGKLVLQQNIQIVTGQNQLDVVIEHLPKGIYFLQLANSDSVHSFTKPD